MLTRELIRKMTNEATYKRGMQLYYSKNRLLDFDVQEKRGTGRQAGTARDIITCRVKDSTGELNKVRLEYDAGAERLVSTACDCLAFANYNGVCKHCLAVLLKYGDWQVKQELYVRPEGKFEQMQPVGNRLAGQTEQADGPGSWDASASAESGANSGAADAAGLDGSSERAGAAGMDDPRLLKAQPYVPVEETTPAMKILLEKRTRKRTAPVTEQQVHGRVRIVPILRLSQKGDAVEFQIGVDRLYVMKDAAGFARLMASESEFSYGKNLKFTHTMASLEPQSRNLARFIMNRFGSMPQLEGTPVRHCSLDAHGLEELLSACEDIPFRVVLEDEPGLRDESVVWSLVNDWPEHELVLTGESEKGKFAGLRGRTQAMVVRRGQRSLFAFEDGYVYRMRRRDADAIEDWLLSLGPDPSRKTRELVTIRRSDDGLGQAVQEKSFYIERSDIPTFCRELLPAMERLFDVKRVDFCEEDFEIARAAFHFYLDSPAKDTVTCRILACYGEREYALYRGQRVESGLADRDLVAELSLWQGLAVWFPVESAAAGVSERILEGDEDGLYAFLTEGLAALQNLGTVFVSDALKRLSVRPSPKVSMGISLSGDMLNLTMEAEGMSSEELAEILTRYDRKKKYHRLKNGDFIQIEDAELQALVDMQEGMGFSEKELRQGVVDVPRFRALYLDKQMCDGAMDGISVDRSRDFKAMVRDMRTVEDNDFEVPESLRGIMREYQKKGFLWLKTLAANGFGGILADDMGLGKTLQVISFLLSEHEEKQAAKARGEEAGMRPTLIVCPASLVYNWESEIRKFAPELETRLIVGNAQERQVRLDSVRPDSDVVCITSYELLRRDIELYELLRFGCQVIDEAQFIKNHYTQAARSVKKVKAGFKVALTGTPIENRLSELWSIFDYLMPGFLYSYDQFHKRLERPIVTGQSSAVMERLQRMIGPFVLRRLKKDVLRDLPDKIEENLQTCLEGEQREIYDAQVMELKTTLEGQSEEEFRHSKLMVLSALTRLRQLCCDPGLVYEDYHGGAAKVDMCMELVGSAMEGGHKMLIFSQFTSLLTVLEKRLEAEGIGFYKLEGATPKEERMAMVEAFNREDDTTPVFLISLKAGGTGLNLTAADVVIHFDPWWNLAAQNQATDRAHRIGQKQVVNVYKLIARDTIEENIVRLQEKKRALADQVLAGDGLGSGNFTREDLLEILG